MKLSEWAETQGISYLTAYRWFKAGKMPVPCYQSGTGTIIVDIPEKIMQDENDTNVVSHFLKKTVEFSKSNQPVEDFAAYILSNYKLEKNQAEEVKKAKPTKEMTNKHFSQFLKKQDRKPEGNMFLIDDEKAVETFTSASAESESSEDALAKELSSIFDPTAPRAIGTVVPLDKSMMVSNSEMTAEFNSALEPSKNKLTIAPIKTLASISRGVITRSTDMDEDDELEEGEEPYIPPEKVTYEEAQAAVQHLVILQMVANEPIAIDRKTKEIFKWSKETFDVLMSTLNLAKK